MAGTSRARRCDAFDPGCVKNHTSAKCRKHNSPARHRTSRVQYDLTLRDAIARRYFYVWRDRWSFRTAKPESGQVADRLGMTAFLLPQRYSCTPQIRYIHGPHYHATLP